MMRLVAAISAFALLGACTTAGQLRQETAAAVIPSAKAPAALAECVFPRVLGIAGGLDVRRSIAAGIEHITADGGSERTVLYDLAFIPQATGTSVEIRGARNVWGGTNDPAELRSFIQQCSRPA